MLCSNMSKYHGPWHTALLTLIRLGYFGGWKDWGGGGGAMMAPP